jgi:pyruvate/2-oxoglutarate dehydrogenase complex dihydrolipoamide acyltransferase (E2) component
MDEAIAELESDKATFELTADKAGVLTTIANEGDVLAIGAEVCKHLPEVAHAADALCCCGTWHLVQANAPRLWLIKIMHRARHHPLPAKILVRKRH